MSPSTAETLIKGKRIPNWSITDQEGEKHTLWDYRQKTHLVLIYDPEAKAKVVKQWLAAVEADQKQWSWLNVKFLVVKKPPKGMTPGIYAINRYGIYLTTFPTERWSFDDLEKEFLYHEAYHC